VLFKEILIGGDGSAMEITLAFDLKMKVLSLFVFGVFGR
jgi:hypothetical protein